MADGNIPTQGGGSGILPANWRRAVSVVDEYDLKVHLVSLNKLESCFGIAQSSLEE